MRVAMAFCGLAMLACAAPKMMAQDAVKVDPAHYTVISENDKVRILKVHYGPGEKSVMHSHPATVAVFLGDGKVKFNYPDGKSEVVEMKAGQAMYSDKAVHLPENVGTTAMDVIVIELKGS